MELTEKKCVPCEGGAKPLAMDQAQNLLKKLDQWQLDEQGQEISKKFSFTNFYKTMAFVNAVAFVANKDNHHPDMNIGYNYCHIHLKTHAISGLSENDFIIAAKIDSITAL